eukprot:COSAG04_NODE_2670_length_3757_cov_3.001367_2_plen_225_part_00
MLAAARRCSSSRLRCGGPSSLRGGARRHAGAGPALSGPAAARVDPAAAAPAPAEGSFLTRLLIPWPELAAMSEDADLSRIEVYSSTYCLISTLMCSVSATALLTAVPDHRGSNAGGRTAGATAEAMAEAILNHELKEQPTPPAAPPIHSGILSRETAVELYLLRGILMSTWGFWPAVFRPLRTVFPGLGAGFLNLGGKTERTAKKRGKNEQKWARNGLKRVGAS